MLVSVQSSRAQVVTALPLGVGGVHWIADAQGARLALVEGRAGAWHVEPGGGYQLKDSVLRNLAYADLRADEFAVVNVVAPSGQTWCLVFHPDDETSIETTVYGFPGDVDLSVGRTDDNDIVYTNRFVSGCHARLAYRGGRWYVGDAASANGTFLNGRRIEPKKTFHARFGDVVSVLGLRITLGAGFVSCNNPNGSARMRASGFVRYRAVHPAGTPEIDRFERAYFYPALRFARSIEKKTFVVDPPPMRVKEEKESLLQRVGPSLLMGFASLMSASVFIFMIADSGSSPLRAIPLLAMALAMLAGTVLWPVINVRRDREKKRKEETVRRGAYSQYLSGVLAQIAREEQVQRDILNENRITVNACLDMASRGDAHLMDRTSLHADYLDVRIGMGDEPLVADIRFPDPRFSVDDDQIRKEVDAQARQKRVLVGVPLAFQLIEKHVAGIVGPDEDIQAFARGVVVQVAALCSYEDVKVVVLCDEVHRSDWEFALYLPHCFSDDRESRYFGCGLEEIGEVGMHIERALEERKTATHFDAREARPYYVVICASSALAEKAAAVRSVMEVRENRGISLVALAPSMQDLPRECRSVMCLDSSGAYLLDRDDPSGARRQFVPDIAVGRDKAAKFALDMARLRLDMAVEKQQMPARLGFLEMYGVGNVDHLNIASRWSESNAATTLACRIGVDASGEPFLLNLHEKFHGPHGLIAGTTGSGKSEFIITWVLSMALTYSPDDVAFVLIDYKGGGLARAFDNEHVRLPHLAGVITNLDGAAIQRSLVSIQSELKRRQALFNRARDVVGGDNIDIYGYLDLFRQGRMSDPCPHLFIVADEFAELKAQQPDFMDELISAARIGRSLGVHLVLATQKPSGVVNDQIWSNARFKVCLKVADAGDSNEMIRRPDAAELQQAGRFYLLVGYNEHFALGQAAYAGTRYVPNDRLVESRDDSVILVSHTGRALVSVKPRVRDTVLDERPESVAVLVAIQKAAGSLGMHARQLWLEPVPSVITVDDLAVKYGHEAGGIGEWPVGRFAIEPIVGEYDDPNRQRQGLLSLPLSDAGNALIYGTPESGVECALNAIAYSLVCRYSARHLNLYLLDFGSESLRAFSAAPQVGDVIGIADDEKVRRFFDFFDREFETRRASLAEYGGSFARYVEAGGDLPTLVVVLNDIAAFMEAYPRLEERFGKFVREAGRCGVYLVATAAGTSSVRMRVRQVFRQVLAVNLADVSEYGLIFGTLQGLPLPKGFGRGLAQLEDGVFEFQAAHLIENGDDYGFASRQCSDRADVTHQLGEPFAPPVPVAPDIVLPAMLDGANTDDFIPYGIYDDDLSIAGFDFSDSPLARCQFQRRKDGAAFLEALLAVTTHCTGWDVAMLDMAYMFGEKLPAGCSFASGEDDDAKEYLTSYVLPPKNDYPDIGLVFSAGKAKHAACKTEGRQLLIITGIVDFISRAGFEFADSLKAFLRELSITDYIRIVLVDAAASNSYAYEDWFKMHLTSKDGLWVGPGIESQTAIGITYSSTRFVPDAEMSATRGYEVQGGITRLVHLASLG